MSQITVNGIPHSKVYQTKQTNSVHYFQSPKRARCLTTNHSLVTRLMPRRRTHHTGSSRRLRVWDLVFPWLRSTLMAASRSLCGVAMITWA